MAPTLQPWSLYRICLSASSSLVDQACTNIFLEHGNYCNQDCTDAIGELQNYLIQSLPLSIFENLSDDRNARTRHQNSLLLWSKDPRIKLGLFLHPSIRKFGVDGKGNELMLMQQQDEFGSSFGGLDELFWCAHISRLVNLVQLNLNLITTDEILLLIGNYCHKLEVVNIVSRIKQDNIPQEPNQDGQPPPILPGITLKFCVSDIGLVALCQCKLLHKITMNKITNQTAMPSNRGITLEGVRKLVKGLKFLEFVSFGSIGKIINHADFDPRREQLRLTYYSECDPLFVDIPKLSQLCPNIVSISLSVPISINHEGTVDADLTNANDILEALAKSKLPLRHIELQHFPFCEAFKELIRKKGHRLQDLLFRAINNIFSEHLIFIGDNCPRLQKLHIKELGPEPDSSMISMMSILNKRLFGELQVLHMGGKGWSPKLLPVMLMSAHKISKLSLLNMSSRINMDQAWNRVLASNKLPNIVSISLYSGCIVSVSLVRKLTLECPRLTFFSFIQSENMELAEVERLRLDVVKKNLNIKLACLEMFEV